MSCFKERLFQGRNDNLSAKLLGFDWDMCTWTACSKDQVEQRCETPTQAALDSFREKNQCACWQHQLNKNSGKTSFVGPLK